MSEFIDMGVNFDDVGEQEVGPKGLYDLVIEDYKEPKEGKSSYLFLVKATKGPKGVDVESMKTIMHNASIPAEGDDETKIRNKVRFLKRFAYAFGVKLEGSKFNPAAFLGKSAKDQQLDVKTYEGQTSNIIVLKEVPNKKK